MKVATFVQTAFQQNTRIVACSETGAAICIDPGEESPEVVRFVTQNSLDLRALVITHGHLDHIGGTSFLKREFPNAEVLVHSDEESLYYSLPRQPLLMGIQPQQLAPLGMKYDDPPRVTRNISHGDILEIGKLNFEVRHCPGHTLGHIILVESNEKVVFTGDCLFNGTIGRTDLPGGNYDQLISSIKANVMSLSDEHTVMCGHGPDTTVGKERISNAFLTGAFDLSTQ